MTKHFEQLSAEERATIVVMAQEGQSLRAMARALHRAPSTISREWRRHAPPADASGSRGYDARRAGHEARRRRFQPRRSPKLAVDGVLFGVVEHFLREGWSPGQIAGALKMIRSVAVLRMRNGTSQSPFRLALGDNPCAPVRPAPGHGYVTTCPQGGGRTSPWPYVEWLDGVSDALASGLCGFGTSPLRHAGQTPAPTPTGDYRPSLRSPWPAAVA